MPQFTGFSHVALTVTDLAASVAWYERVFPGTFQMMEEHEDGHAFVLVVLGGAVLVGFHAHSAMPPGDRFAESRIGLDHLSFQCADTEALKEWLAHLDELGVEHSGLVERPYGNLIAFRDPDNIALEVYSLTG